MLGRMSTTFEIPTLHTERLTLRAPRREDAKTIAALANDRRIAENLLRLPHPYVMPLGVMVLTN